MMPVLIKKFGYITTLIIAFTIILYWIITGYSGNILLNRLTQSFGVMSVVYLYVVLMIGATYSIWPELKFKGFVFTLRKQLGLSTFLISCVHGFIAFFGQLGGVAGLEFLTSRYLVAIVISTLALIFLGLMTITSWPKIKAALGKYWKTTHKIIYAVLILVIFHVLIIGTHYRDLKDPLSQISIWALVLLLVLESIRIDRYLQRQYPRIKQSLALVVTSILLTVLLLPVYTQKTSQQPLSVHNRHDDTPAEQTVVNTRYNVTYTTNKELSSQEKIDFKFNIHNATTGEIVKNFTMINNQVMHVSVVDDSLETLQDYHPLYLDGTFFQTIQFPYDTNYHVLFNFYPSDSVEQQVQITIDLSNGKTISGKTHTPDTNFVKYSGDYQVILVNKDALNVNKLRSGEELIIVDLTDRATKHRVENLPYLGALSSISLVSTKTKQFITGHATNLKPSDSYLRANTDASQEIVSHSHIGELNLAQGQLGGPEVQFQLNDTYGKLEPGIYKAFMGFNPGGNNFQVIFTLEIK